MKKTSFIKLCRHRQYIYGVGTRRRLCAGSSEVTNSNSSTLEDCEVPRVYDSVRAEQEALQKWKNVDKVGRTSGSVFRMLLPPPNVTGKLHLGHFLTLTIEDTIARWKLMTGTGIEWIPGFDHAGIATHSVVSRKISKQSEARPQDIGKSLLNFSSSNLSSIQSQLEKSGALLDWDKKYYTLDEDHSSVVKEAFLQLFDSGLIKRADGMVNWSSILKTSIADIEIEEVDFDKKISVRVPNYKDMVEFGVLYFIEYPISNSDEKLVVATSRPETMFGDVALAVNPGDSRYAQFVGKHTINPINGKALPIIADALVKPDFGSGIVKITPAHDKLDFTIGSVHGLNYCSIFTPDGLLNENAGEFQGVPRFIARKKVLEILNSKNAVVQEKSYSGSVNLCSRSGDVIEPRVVPHWFLRTAFLSNKLIQAIENKSFLIIPEHHAKSLVHQLTDSQDWCLSRQIKWGHRIPAFYHINHPEKWVAARNLESAVSKLEEQLSIKITDHSMVVQDPDVLDTWFSSALIPLSVSGWPDSDEFKEITLMETGHDILLFWIWRMAILTLALVDRFPFRHVLLHGIVTDTYGRKMSKSKGNVIDPMHIIDGISYKGLMEEAKDSFASGELDETEFNLRKVTLEQNLYNGFPVCGNDALRLTLLSQNILDNEITIDLNYLDSCRKFTNKIWQALRFLKLHSNSIQEEASAGEIKDTNATRGTDELACKWILACLYDFNKICESSLNQAKFHLYAEGIRKFFYQELCDVYIELVKGEMKNGNDISQYVKVMQYVFEVGVKLSHPLIPFVSEEIWSHLRSDKSSILLEQDFPSSKELEQFHDPELRDSMSKAMHLTREIRSVKKRSGWSSKETPQVYVEGEKSAVMGIVGLRAYVSKLSNSNLIFGRYPSSEKASFGSFLVDIGGNICRIHIPMTNIAVKANDAKIQKLKLKLMKLQQQYENPAFQLNAPPAVKEKLKKKVETLFHQLQDHLNEAGDHKNPNPP